MELDKRKSTVTRLLAKKRSSKKKDEIPWSYIQDKYDLGMELRRPFEQRWLVNLNFLAGKQYVFYNQSAFMLQVRC